MASYVADPGDSTIFEIDLQGNRGAATTISEITGGVWDYTGRVLYRVGSTVDTWSIGQAGPINFQTLTPDGLQVTYQTGRGQLGAIRSGTAQEIIGGIVQLVMPDGSIRDVPIQNAYVSPVGYTVFARTDLGPIPEYYAEPISTTLQELRDRLGTAAIDFATSDQLAVRGIMGYLRRRETQLIEDYARQAGYAGSPGDPSGFYTALHVVSNLLVAGPFTYGVNRLVSLSGTGTGPYAAGGSGT